MFTSPKQKRHLCTSPKTFTSRKKKTFTSPRQKDIYIPQKRHLHPQSKKPVYIPKAKRRLHPPQKKMFTFPKKKDVYIPEAKKRLHPLSKKDVYIPDAKKTFTLVFPMWQDSATFWDKVTEVPSLTQDKGKTGQAQNLATGRDGLRQPVKTRDGTRDKTIIIFFLKIWEGTGRGWDNR